MLNIFKKFFTKKRESQETDFTASVFELWSTDFSKDPLDYAIDFYYEASTGRYGVALYECVYDEYYEDFMCYAIYGDVSSDGEINGYMPFEKVN